MLRAEKDTMNPGIEICLTGGFGSGKSTVAKMLVERGTKLVDADAIARKMQAPGHHVFDEMVAYFGRDELLGDDVLTEDGTLDRPAISAIVFNEKYHLNALNQIVHPPLEKKMRELRQEYLESGEMVLVDFPLLVEARKKAGEAESLDEPKTLSDGKTIRKGSGFDRFDGIIVVDCDKELAVERLIKYRGFKREDAYARMAQQATREQRRAVADFLIENDGDMESLGAQVEKCFEWIKGLLNAKADELNEGC